MTDHEVNLTQGI